MRGSEADAVREAPRGFLRLRVHQLDTHYTGGLLAGASLARMMTDCASEIGIRMYLTDSYLASYEKLEFLAPVYAGDYLEITAELLELGRRSRRVAVEAKRVVRVAGERGALSRYEVVEPSETVGRGILVSVVPKGAVRVDP